MGAVWGIARVSLLMALRRVAALAVVALLGAGLVLLATSVEGDQTLTGQLRVMLSWSQTFLSFALTALTVYLASTSLSSEFQGKQMLMLASKPVPRWQILLGKWLGLAAITGWLLIVLGALIVVSLYAVTVGAQAEARTAGGVERVLDIDRAMREVLISRRSYTPVLEGFEEDVERTVGQLVARGVVSEAETREPAFREWVRTVRAYKRLPIEPGATRSFRFEGLPTEAGGELVVRAKLFGRSSEGGEPVLAEEWSFGNSGSGRSWTQRSRSRSGQAFEVIQSAEAIGAGGDLELRLKNISPPQGGGPGPRIVVPAVEGLELLVPQGGFLGNFARGLILLWIRLLALGAIGLSLSTFLRGQVTAFALITVVLAGLLGGALEHDLRPPVESYAELQARKRAEAERERGVIELVGEPLREVLPYVLELLPDFAETDPAPDWRVGREITWGRLLWQAFVDVMLRGGLCALLGWQLFERREVGLPVS